MIRPQHVDILILGAGWTSTFLLPLLKAEKVSHAATTTSGRDGTIPFKFDPSSSDADPYKALPAATTVLITFPLTGHGQSKRLTELYGAAHADAPHAHFIQLGATSIWKAPTWSDRNSTYDTQNARAIAEDELIASPINGTALDLAGLYGGERQPRTFLTRILKSKEDVRGKQALHMVHGRDVARAVLAVHRRWEHAKGQRWLLTDLHCYDWYDLVLDWCAPAQDEAVEMSDEQRKKEQELVQWVWECMLENDVKAIPRGPEKLGRVLDSREFWSTMKIVPSVGRLR